MYYYFISNDFSEKEESIKKRTKDILEEQSKNIELYLTKLEKKNNGINYIYKNSIEDIIEFFNKVNFYFYYNKNTKNKIPTNVIVSVSNIFYEYKNIFNICNIISNSNSSFEIILNKIKKEKMTHLNKKHIANPSSNSYNDRFKISINSIINNIKIYIKIENPTELELDKLTKFSKYLENLEEKEKNNIEKKKNI